MSALQELNELRAVKFDAVAQGEPWTLEQWRDVTGSHYPIVRLGEGLLALSSDELAAKVAEMPSSAAFEFAENVAQVVDWTKNHLEIMEAVQARWMIALVRNCEDPPPEN